MNVTTFLDRIVGRLREHKGVLSKVIAAAILAIFIAGLAGFALLIANKALAADVPPLAEASADVRGAR